MDLFAYHAAVVAEVAKMPGWTERQAMNFVGEPGDVADAWQDEMSPPDYVAELLHAANT